MTILDRYIARQYLFNTAALLVLLFSFVVTVDVALNIDRFLETARKYHAHAGDGGGEEVGVRKAVLTVYLIADLWWPRLVQLYNFMIGLVLVGAMGFTCTQLVRHRELVATLAGGISLYRVARPVVAVAVLALGVQVLNQELVIPRIAPLLARDHGDAGRHEWNAFDLKLTKDGRGRIFQGRTFDPDTGVVEGMNVWERDEQGRATRRITASRATWRDGGWDLTGGEAIPLRLAAVGGGAAGGRGSGGGANAAGGEVVARIETDLDPTALLVRRYAGFSQSLSWSRLYTMLRAGRLGAGNGSAGADAGVGAEAGAEAGSEARVEAGLRERLMRVALGRVSTLISNLLALVIAMPFFLMREPRNMLAQSLKCAPVAIVALMGGVLGVWATVPGLPVWLSVFLPVLILTPVAIATTGSVRT